MVVLASAIVTKSGKPLVSRQFIEMSRIRVEGLLAAFPKLVGTGKQHTYVETENIRYVFQPIEGLYLLLLTNKQSNIVEDLDTLRLLSKVIPELASPIEEETIGRAAFELIFAFDEVISMGHKENIRASQVKQNIEMESMEEKLHKMIIQSKIDDTKDHMRRMAAKLDKDKIEKARVEKMGGYVPQSSGMGGMGGYDSGAVSSLGGNGGGGGGGGGGGFDTGPSFRRPEASSKKASTGKKGMQLGKGRKNNVLEKLMDEGEVVESEIVQASKPSVAMPAEPVSITIDEKLVATLNRDGGVEVLEANGVMTLEVHSDEASQVLVNLAPSQNQGFQFKTHPNIDKGRFSSENVLSLKNPDRPFPTGTALSVLKWRWSTREESKVPLIINCWPSPSGDETYVNMDYEAIDRFDLKNVVISIPLPTNQSPSVNEVDGDWHYNSRRNTLEWTIDLIDSTNRTGSLEFVVPQADADDFFPVDISFGCSGLMCDIAIDSVENPETGEPTKFSFSKTLQTGEYQVV
ncbi:hypothetical protein BSKO_07401 [Bryopsis sp. KO-2023]|nr:hypothetical protein BSKO_07401 [Bryopsis sp. KO-2023]